MEGKQYFSREEVVEYFKRMKDDIVNLIEKYECELNDSENKLNKINEIVFNDEEDRLKFECDLKQNVEQIKMLLMDKRNELVEVDECIVNPPQIEKEVQHEVKRKVKTFDEEIEDWISYKKHDIWKLFIENVVDDINDQYYKTIKSVIKEYRSGFDNAINEVSTFINKCLITKDLSLNINKNLIISTFDSFYRYIVDIQYRAVMSADPPKDDSSESAKVCCRATMKNFNKLIDVKEFIRRVTRDIEREGVIHVRKIENWIDTIETGEWFLLNNLVESYNDFHHTAIGSKEFGRLMKGKFDTKRKTINKVKYTFYYKI